MRSTCWLSPASSAVMPTDPGLRQCQKKALATGARLELEVRQEKPAGRLCKRRDFRVTGEDDVAVEMV